jgi:hypothetical protein
MPKRTLRQVIDAAKSGEAVDPDECRDAMLALHSMLVKSRMALEVIADTMENPTNLYYITRAYLGCPEILQAERDRWMNRTPAIYLKEMDIRQQEITTFYENINHEKA